MKRQNVDLKNDVIKFSEEIHNREQELSSICNKFKNQLNQAKKTIHEKENML